MQGQHDTAPGWDRKWTLEELASSSAASREGISFEEELSMRIKFALFMQRAGLLLDLEQITIARAITFFQYFYTSFGFRDYDPYIMCSACLFLASKVGETQRRLRDVINCTYRVRHPDQEPLAVNESMWKLKSQVIFHEQVLLREFMFDVEPKLPHEYVLHFIRMLRPKCYPSNVNDLSSVAWSIANDSLCTTLCLQYEPHKIACGCIYVAAELLSVRMSFGDEEWWNRLSTHRIELEQISHQILDLYEHPMIPSEPLSPRTENRHYY